MAIDYTASTTPDYTHSDTATELQQLNNLRESVKSATLTHLRQKLAKTLPSTQVTHILGHKNVELELNRLIQRVSLEPHSNINSLSFKIAQGLTQVTDPHLLMAINLATAGENQPKPEDILQEVIKQNAHVQSAYNPLSDSLRPAGPDGQTSKLYEKLKSPLINGPHGIPTLKPEIDKVVALGLKGVDAAQQQQIAEALNQDLLGELLTHQATTPTNTEDVVKNYFKTHGLDTNSIDSQSFAHFVDYVNKLHQTISVNDQVALLQIASENLNISSQNLQDILRALHSNPENLLHEVETTPPTPPPSLPPNQSPNPPPSTPKAVDAAIKHADHYHYAADASSQPNNYLLRQVFTVFNRFVNYLQQSSRQNLISRFEYRFNFSSSGSAPSISNFSPDFGDFFNSTFGTPGHNPLSSFQNAADRAQKLAQTVKKLAQLAQKIKKLAQLAKAFMTALSTIEVWGPALIIIGIIILIFILAAILPGTHSIISTNIAPIPGSGGGIESELISNPFVDLTKTGDPGKLDSPSGKISYTYTITPKQGPLSNVTIISDKITIFTQNNNVETDIVAPTPPPTVDSTWASDPYSFTLDSSMDDSIITNTITIQATAPDNSPLTIQASFSTIIGNPPTGCFIFNNGPMSQITTVSWDSYPNEKQKETGSVSTILAKLGVNNVCGGPINLFLASSGVDINYGGWYLGAGNIALDFKRGSLGTPNNALYTLAHETGHELAGRLPSVYADFVAENLVYWNGSCVNNIYPFLVYLTSEGACYNENFAEGIARFVNPAAKGSLPGNWLDFFQSHFP